LIKVILAISYSSRIQLPTETPPQLIPIPILWARLSRRLLAGLPFTEIGLAPFSNLDISECSGLRKEGFDESIGGARKADASLLAVCLNAAVKLEAWLPRGDVEGSRGGI